MATGTVKWFAQALLDLGNKIHDIDTDDLRLGIVTAATVPTLATAAPHWGGTGTTNFATNQVALATAYTGPIALASKTWSLVSNVATFRAAIVSIAQDAGGFVNGAYGIIFNNTDANKRALAFVELSSAGTLSLAAGAVDIDWSGANNDILTLTQS